MNLGTLRLRHLVLAIGMAVATTSAHLAHGQDDTHGMAGTVLVTVGEQYVAARTSALELPKDEFDRILIELARPGPASPAAVVASALKLRKEAPELAQEFDSRVKESVEGPSVTSRSGRPQYTAWWPKDRPELDPLVFELIVKRTVPEGLRHEFIAGMGRPNGANVDSILALADSEGVTYAGMLRGAAVGDAAEQDRITPHIVRIHKKWRSQGHVSSGAIYALASFGREQQLLALKEIREFERQCAAEEGMAPWSDADARKAFVAALVELNDAQVRLNQVRKDGPGSAEVREASREVEAMKAKADACQKRCHVRELWLELEQRIGTMEVAKTRDAGGAVRESDGT